MGGYTQVFFNWLVSDSLMGGLVALIILALKGVLKDKLGVKLQYAIWIILLLRIILPWAPQSPLSIFNLVSLAEGQNQLLSQSANITGVNSNGQKGDAGIKPAGNNDLVPVPKLKPVEPKPLVTAQLAYYIWLFGFILLGVYISLINLRFSFHLNKAQIVRDEKILELFAWHKGKMAVNTHIPVLETDKVKGPVLFGVLKPKLLLPAGIDKTLGSERLGHIFSHELAHFKRKDLAVNWLSYLILTLHWFNPILWYAFYRMRADQEIACDALALSYLKPEETREYGYTIIHLLGDYARISPLQGMAHFSATKAQLKRRVRMIKMFEKSSYKWSIAGLVIVMLLGGIALTNAKTPDNSLTGPQKYVARPGQGGNGAAVPRGTVQQTKVEPILKVGPLNNYQLPENGVVKVKTETGVIPIFLTLKDQALGKVKVSVSNKEWLVETKNRPSLDTYYFDLTVPPAGPLEGDVVVEEALDRDGKALIQSPLQVHLEVAKFTLK